MKNFFVLCLTMLLLCSGFNLSAANAKDNKKTVVSSITIATNTLDELKHFSWDNLREIFKDNPPNDSIKIQIIYKSTSNTQKGNFTKSFTFLQKDKQSNINEMIKKLSTSIDKLIRVIKD